MIDQEQLPARRAVAPAFVSARRDHLECALADLPPRLRVRKPLVLGVMALGTLATTGAAAAYVATRPASVHDQARCYATASLAGGEDFKGTTVGLAQSADGKTGSASAVELCATVWRAGVVRSDGGPVPDKLATDLPVPPLVACTLNNGVAAVFPGDARTCEQLGLPSLDTSAPDAGLISR